ncbi:hypothetical protein HHK36_016042 [Tetracentron sinense]|uniref:Uncharacterized protein n=1 Tax=Tetracentron sinense TaxID=13715 RepID=A0A834Z030_TETSI|nr:hypothetical protein HHK36_016042 [Tetracentron sinense]
MRKRKERTERSKTLMSEGSTGHEIREEEKGFFACYLLCSLSPRHKGHTYIGDNFLHPLLSAGDVLCLFMDQTIPLVGYLLNGPCVFEWAWQHPTVSLAVRKAAASLKPLSGIAKKMQLAYTMLTLPAWQSLNLTLNFFSTKYTKHSAGCPSLPKQMKVQVCPMEELPCYTECGQTSYENDDDCDDENDDDVGHLKERFTDASDYGIAKYSYSFEKTAHERSGWIEDDGFRHPSEPLTPRREEYHRLTPREEDHRLPSHLVDLLTRTPSSSIIGSLNTVETVEESNGKLGQSMEQQLPTPKAGDNDQPPMNILLSPEVEVINVFDPSASDCLIRYCRKKKRASSVCPEIIDLTKSPI